MLKTRIFKNYKGKALENLKDEEAEIRLSLLIKPGDRKILEKLASILYYVGDIDGAINIYNKLVSFESENSDFLGFLGYLHYERDDFKKASELLEKAVKKDQNAPFIHFLLGNAYSRMGMIREAAHNYDFAIFLDLDIYLAYRDFAQKYEEMGREKKALKEYIAAYEIDPRDEKLLKKIEWLQERVGGKI
ncbi:MAG: tetratricopeptide repeat protein [Fusobacteriaceae bacterium]